MTRSDAVALLAKAILNIDRPHPVRVAIDGVDAAGKTSLAGEIATELSRSSRQVVRASIDGFHNPRGVRRQDDSGEGYFRCSFNYPLLFSCLLDPLGPGGSRQFRYPAFDSQTDREVASDRAMADRDAILVMDGVFLLRRELRRHWDLAIFIEAAFETTLARAEVRDGAMLGGADGVRQRYATRYIPGQRLYLEQEHPREAADVVVINDNIDAPQLEFRI
jgi:uridine kinase